MHLPQIFFFGYYPSQIPSLVILYGINACNAGGLNSADQAGSFLFLGNTRCITIVDDMPAGFFW
jgi:hypothetical protein